MQAVLHRYIYFDSTPGQRASDMYNLAVADPAILSLDTSKANLTPAGEILSIGDQPSRAVLGAITVPVLLLLAQNDDLFPPSVAGVDYGALELALFAGAADRTLRVVPDDGHMFMRHPNAPASRAWLPTGSPRGTRAVVPESLAPGATRRPLKGAGATVDSRGPLSVLRACARRKASGSLG